MLQQNEPKCKLCVNTFIIEIKLLEQPELEKEIHSRI
jgi:hypothetical protein